MHHRQKYKILGDKILPPEMIYVEINIRYIPELYFAWKLYKIFQNSNVYIVIIVISTKSKKRREKTSRCKSLFFFQLVLWLNYLYLSLVAKQIVKSGSEILSIELRYRSTIRKLVFNERKVGSHYDHRARPQKVLWSESNASVRFFFRRKLYLGWSDCHRNYKQTKLLRLCYISKNTYFIKRVEMEQVTENRSCVWSYDLNEP